MINKRRVLSVCSISALALASASAAELIYQEGFNTDGSTGANPRYTFTGRDVFEVPRIQSELGNYDQKGPLYWAHNFDVSYVGNPTIPARRAIFTWKPEVGGAPGVASEDLLQLWDSTVNWLVNNKANATIVVFPDTTAIGELADRLTAAGHTVVSDDTVTYPDEQDVPGDLFIHAGTSNPSRFAMTQKPVIVMSEPDYDDMLVGSIGAAASFDPGLITITTPGHPAAGGKTGTLTGFSTGPVNFGLVGSFLPSGATTLATVLRTIPPAINNLADVDSVIAGTKQNENSAGTVTDIDFSDGSSGNWFYENTIPGGYTGNWGLRVQGQLNVSAAGEYRFAVGSDDGARLYIDLDRNGLTTADLILEDTGPHGHQIVYQNANFPAAGNYPFEVRSYNSGGGGSLEVSVSLQTVPIPDDALESGYWDILSENGFGPIKMQGAANVTGYVAAGANVEEQTPLIVLLNGPTDNPPGAFYDGGPFTSFEGTGFIGASGLNKWPYPDGASYRTVRLQPVDVTGKTNVKLTIKLAATVVDFETSDLLDVVVYPNGPSSTPVTLAHFRGVVNAVQPWLADENENYVRRLTRDFKDFTYNVPTNATQLIVEIRAATTWWTEIAAFDDIRITAGAASTEEPSISVARQGNNVVITFANGTLQSASALAANPAQTAWNNISATGTHTVTPAEQGAAAFFRVQR
jgi:hypothetical protein